MNARIPSRLLLGTFLVATSVLPCSIASAQCLLNTNLVGWWSANEDSDDHSGHNNDGILNNGAELGHGISWWSFCFDGVDDDVTIPHHPNQNLGAGFTVDAWIFTYGPGQQNRPIVQKRSASNVGGFTLETTHGPSGNNYGLQFVIWIGGVAKTAATPANVYSDFLWTHVAATYNGVVMKIYVNGVEKASAAALGSIDASTEPIVLGRNVVTSQVLGGCIDELHLFNRALTQSEIQWIHDSDYNGICPTAVGPHNPTITLSQNYPNPFNPTTVIDYELSEVLDVNLTIFDADGHQVRALSHGLEPAGTNSVRWDGKDDNGHDVATGVYFCRLQAGSVSQTRKMVLLK